MRSDPSSSPPPHPTNPFDKPLKGRSGEWIYGQDDQFDEITANGALADEMRRSFRFRIGSDRVLCSGGDAMEVD